MINKLFFLFWITLICQAQTEKPAGSGELDLPALSKLINIPFGKYQLTDQMGPSSKEKCLPLATIQLVPGPDGIDLWIGGSPIATNLERSIYSLEDEHGERCQTTLYTTLDNGSIYQKAIRKCQEKEVTEEFKIERLGDNLIKMTYLGINCIYHYRPEQKANSKK